jgi:hypothetical protein
MVIMAMPMGYLAGQSFVERKAKRYEDLNDQRKVKNDYSFLPLMCALLLPFGTIIAIMEIMMKGNEHE